MRPLYSFIGGFIFGAALFSAVDPDPASLFLVCFAAVILLAAFCIRRSKAVFFLVLIVLGGALGAVRIAAEEFSFHDPLVPFSDSFVQIEGVVVSEPDQRERSTKLTVRVDSVNGGMVSGRIKVLMTTDRFPEFLYGDKVRAEGKLERPENFENEDGREFNYIEYLKKDGIFYTMYFPDTTVLGTGGGNVVKRSLFSLKHIWLSSVERLLPDPHASLLGGLVVGAKQSLGSELEEDFRRAGVIHVVVLSGYNVTIVAEAIMRFFSFLRPLFAMSLGALSIVLFAVMTGGSATIIRASIMALLVILARATGRTNDITHGLFLAGFCMVFHNPSIVLYDPSFELSFLATLGLIYLSPLLEKWFRFVPAKWKLREIATATIATQLFVLPLLLYMMGEFSLVALVVNMLVLGAIPLTMLAGFLAGVFGIVSPLLAFPFTALSYALLSYELFVVELFSHLPFASVSVPQFPFWLMIFFYLLYGFILRYVFKRHTLKNGEGR